MRPTPRARWHRSRPVIRLFQNKPPVNHGGGESATSVCLLVRRCAGFTLLEMVMVVIVIGVTAAVVTPKWLENDLDVDAIARQLQNDIRYVQGMAMNRGQRHRIYFDVAASYRIADNTGAAVAHPLQPSGSVTFPSGVAIASNGFSTGYLSFDGRGVPYNGAAAISADTSVQLSKSGVTRTLVVTPQTGYVTVTTP